MQSRYGSAFVQEPMWLRLAVFLEGRNLTLARHFKLDWLRYFPIVCTPHVHQTTSPPLTRGRILEISLILRRYACKVGDGRILRDAPCWHGVPFPRVFVSMKRLLADHLRAGGELVPPPWRKIDEGGTLLAGIYLTPIPAMDYERYVFYERDIHSVTSNTRQDGHELLAEAAQIPVRPHTTVYPLAEANRALQDLKADRIHGTGVRVM